MRLAVTGNSKMSRPGNLQQQADGYRSFVVASQSITWLVGRISKLRFAIEKHQPSGLFEHGPERCLILAPTHQSLLDPWLIMSGLRYRQWRALLPLRTLATQTFYGPLRWFKPLIRFLYRLEGAVELPPKEQGDGLVEKLQGLLEALRDGDVVMIFPRYVIEIGRPLHIPESLDLEAGASWLRERTMELYQRAKSERMNVS